MNTIQREFFAGSGSEQEWLRGNTWCDECGEADLGMISPQEYAENGEIFWEGICKRCNQAVRSEITEANTE